MTETKKTTMITLDVDPDVGSKGDTIEYAYHFDRDGTRAFGQDLDFADGVDWRRVKSDIEMCVQAARKGELHDDIVHIEKVWHNNRTQETWQGYATVWDHRTMRRGRSK